jgi:GDPmannose 4,6-dehydratase
LKKTAFITGISGQDGAYLSKLLLKKGYKVIGGDRRTASGSLWRLEELGISKEIEITDFELAEFTNIYRVIEKYKPDEVYNLAAQSFVAASFEMPTMTSDITGLGVSRILEALRQINPEIKFYQASSSEMFGKIIEAKQNEETPFHPRSPYAVAKLFGHWMTINYRESYDMFACSGILFNHESPLRGAEFVTRKITIGLSKIKQGKFDCLELGNMNAKRDWGYAADYVNAMYLMLQHDTPDDYVVASGINYSIRDFVNKACNELDMKIEWEGEGLDEKVVNTLTGKTILKVNPKYYRPAEVEVLLGDSSKARKILKWEPRTSFEELVSMMVKSDYNKLNQE